MLSPSPTPYQQALQFLYGRINYERAPIPREGLELDRMRRLMARLGDPHLQVPIIHVAGTKGKGSVSAMLASALHAAGFRTGLYTSPHLERLEERYVIDGRQCSEDQLAGLVEQMLPAADQFEREGDPPTFFELTTALAFMHFAQQAADVAVLEVGMGGRLDSTNVCQPLLSVITSISFDHTKALGDTLAAIAGEKAGIIKPGVPVVSGVMAAGAREKVASVARERGCRLVQMGAEFDYAYQPVAGHANERRHAVTYQSDAGTFASLGEIELSMLGEHQAANAATAIAALEEMHRLGWQLEPAHVARGVAAARCPARIEVVGRSPTVILDAAHNAAAAGALAETIGCEFGHRRAKLLFAIARDKDIASVLAPLAPCFDELLLTRFQSNPRGAEPANVAGVAKGLAGAEWTVKVIEQPADALEAMTCESHPDDLLVIAGSFFLAAELRPLLQQVPSPLWGEG